MKKTLAILLAMALLCMMAVGTTLTYFTDSEGQANVMTVGKVDIEQKEVFPSAQLYPYTGTIGGELDLSKNALTKTVTVENKTGSETAFIRTLFAFEAANIGDPAVATDPIAANILYVNYNDASVGTWKLEGNFTLSGVTYYVYSFTYAKSYAAGTSTEASLKKIALDGQQGNEFSDGSYEILAVSQAVQAQGFGDDVNAAFTAAFPISEAKLIEWFGSLNP